MLKQSKVKNDNHFRYILQRIILSLDMGKTYSILVLNAKIEFLYIDNFNILVNIKKR